MTTTQTGGGNGAAPDGGFSLSDMVGKRLCGVEEKDDELIVVFVGGLDDEWSASEAIERAVSDATAVLDAAIRAERDGAS